MGMLKDAIGQNCHAIGDEQFRGDTKQNPFQACDGALAGGPQGSRHLRQKDGSEAIGPAINSGK